MNNEQNNMEEREAFFKTEVADLPARNEAAASDTRPLPEQRPVVVACMDERCTLTEEALGLIPHHVLRLATGGGRVMVEQFSKIFEHELTPDGTGNMIYLVTHEVAGRRDLGCAAFKNDIDAQEKYFWDLKNELAQHLPDARIHVVCMDTTTGGIRAIDIDQRDDEFQIFAERGGTPRFEYEDQNHGGYGIYVGEAYRAWNSTRNAYFHISAVSPTLESDLNIALTVITEHSDVNLSNKPVILHLDAPRGTRTSGLIASMTQPALRRFLNQTHVREMLDNGELKIVRTATNLETWRGKVVQSVLQTMPGI